MKYIANQEIQTINRTFNKGDIVPIEFVTSRMKEMCLISPVHDEQTQETRVEPVKETKRAKKHE